MRKIIIEGGYSLTGTIPISGAKNSAVALVPAAILSDDIVTIDNIPNISDIDALNEILEYLGANVIRKGNLMSISSKNIENKPIPEKVSNKLRASYYFMAALLGKYKHVEMYFPGGCSIGARPIDQTLKAFQKLGATIVEYGNKFTIDAKELKGAHIYLDMPSVGATINTILASVKAKGVTILENAAREPEIVSIATFLNNMGARVVGAGTSRIMITGVQKLGSSFSEVIPDRIEAGTYLIAGALIGKNLTISNIIPSHIESLTSKLIEIGYDLKIDVDSITISSCSKKRAVDIKTLGYPGFPTDLQQPITVLLTQCLGISTLEETIYENRFQNVKYLNNMGASIEIKNNKLKIKGPTNLKAKYVEATDLRAGACMILAGLLADGVTTIGCVEHILRGYENIIEKFANVGAHIKLVDD